MAAAAATNTTATLDLPSTLFNPALTFHLDSYSCIRAVYYAHMALAYVTTAVGIGAFLSRIRPAWKWTHAWFGRAYILSMLWTTATSILIHNSGLPSGIIYVFLWCLGGMSLGWLVIIFFQKDMDQKAKALVGQRLMTKLTTQGSSSDSFDASIWSHELSDLELTVIKAKGAIATSKTTFQRIFSLKALHGALMLVSWANMAGSVVMLPPPSTFYCFTYPVYKPINTPKFQGESSAAAAATHLPTYSISITPWKSMGVANWAVAWSVGPFFLGYLIGAVYSYVEWRDVTKKASGATQGKVSSMEGGLPVLEVEARSS
jgi:hypothetical protein